MNKTRSLVAALLVLVPVVAHAGERVTQNVVITPDDKGTGGTATGALGTARNSADPRQAIGCQLWVTESGGSSVSCWARTEASVWASCYSPLPSSLLREAVHSLNGDSLLQFQWGSTGRCIAISVSHASTLAPKAP